MITDYFGTSTTEKGHFHRKIFNGQFVGRIDLRCDELPIHPEQMVEGMRKGSVNLIHTQSPHGVFTIVAIAGSPNDDRPGCKSVFWLKNDIVSLQQMKDYILGTACCKEIIEKMPFKVDW